MAFEEKLETVSMLSGADYTAGTSQYLFVVMSAAKTVIVNTTAGADAFGVIQDTPRTNQASTIAIGGVSKVVAGAAVAAGAQVMSNASGQAVTATTGNRIMGTALTAATAAGQVIPVKLDKNGVAP